jgi:hypothetical protein
MGSDNGKRYLIRDALAAANTATIIWVKAQV